MLELGPDEVRFHRELGAQAGAAGVETLITVGPLAAYAGETYRGTHHHADDAVSAAALLRSVLRDGDTVLVKGSRAVGLEVVAAELAAGAVR
jgi:UDP-N-acetylmuramoyl-tripeptide--D-alanyl-D-alanine ligase